MHLAGYKGLDASNIALNIGDLYVETFVAKKLFVARNPERREIDDDARDCDADFSKRLGGIGLRQKKHSAKKMAIVAPT